jgi:flagellar biosynthetic protein FlhB
MAEDMGDKTEAPTPRRRTEAREQGNIARSADLTAACLLIGGLLLLRSFGPGVVAVLRELLQTTLAIRPADLDPQRVGPLLLWAIGGVGMALAPMMIGALLIAMLANIAQTGLFFSTARLTPNLNVLNPATGFKRLLGRGQGAMKLLMNLAKLILVAMCAYSAIHGRLEEIVLSQRLQFIQIVGLAAGIVFNIAMRIGILLLVLSILDYLWQRHRIEQQLKMSKQEVKDEMKRMDGDPKIKARRRQIALQRHKERLKNDVPKADVVVTNPTEFAVALQYDPHTMAAPRVVAKGQGLLAAQIRMIAIANGIPILERKPLARALYKMCAVGQEVPEQFYSAIAEILAYVYELTGRSRVRRQSA